MITEAETFGVLAERSAETLPGRRWMRFVPSSPGRIALLWALTAVIAVANTVIFASNSAYSASSVLYLSGTPLFAGLVAARTLHLKQSILHLLGAFVCLRFCASLANIVLKLLAPVRLEGYINGSVWVVYLLAVVLVIYISYRGLRGRRRRTAAILLALAINVGAGALLNMDDFFSSLSAQARPLLGRKDPSRVDSRPPEIYDDVLWNAQSALIEKEVATFETRVPERMNVYAMAVAGSGTQALFSREAHEALRVSAVHFGEGLRGEALLSNGAADLMHHPLATRSNIGAVAQAIGAKANHKQDLLFVYLASHGSQTAELASELPSYRSVQPISAASTAEALKMAGVAKRVIVVSACFAATWIPALADDNTIVIAAAAKDRTSFGCDDSRRLTFFGEALLGSMASRGVSLHDAFEDAKRKISTEEGKEKVTPSLPQAFVGRNMEAFWLGREEDAHQTLR